MKLNTLIKQTKLDQFSIGSVQWWNEVTSMGTPIQVPLSTDQTQLIFLWREEESKPKHQAIYLDINGVINHHDFNAAELNRYQDTDVYYYVCNVENSWNGTYALIPVPQEAVQPTYHGDKQQQITQHRNWIMKRRAYHIADPLNKQNLPLTKWGEMHSRIYLDSSVIHPSWEDYDQSHFALDEMPECQVHNYESELLKQNRRFWTYSTANQSTQALPLVIVLDGEFWVESMPIMRPLEYCTQKNLLPPAIYVMIDAISFRQRAEDLTCNPTFWQAVVEEIIPQVNEQYCITTDSSKTVVAGQSYGGLSALYAVLNWPNRFGNAISQSGSFWWPKHALIHNSHEEGITQSLPETLHIDRDIDSLSEMHKLNVYMEVGQREQMMIPLAEHVCDKLLAANHKVTMQLYDGGHDRLIWREGLMKGLIWLFNETD
ncbi:enterochelin esterase [Vibrio sp.]|uniref:enterochelin esterase n=1 Tax=Vibrio sp. TaxID=678 RepID=UPI003AA99322